MKKILLAVSVILLIASSCSRTKVWTEKEKETLRTTIRDHKEKSFLRHMAKDNYANLEECVVTTIAETYPDYNAYAQMPAQTDTLVGVMVSCTSDILGPNYENLAVVFPPDVLQVQGILPAGLTPEQTAAFYQDLAGRLKAAYNNPYVFLLALANDSATESSFIQAMQQAIATVAPLGPGTTTPAQ